MAIATVPRRKSADFSRYLTDPDVALMLRVQRDDEAAFEELVERYRVRVFGNFMHRLGDRQEAEDLTQEVFLRLYRSRHRYRPCARLCTWVFHISQNVARNALRARRRHPAVGLGNLVVPPPGSSPDALMTDPGDGPSRPMERSELVRIVRDAVSALGGRQRMAVEMHQFQDRTYAEVAAQLKVTPEAAKSLLFRARNQLRASLRPFVNGVE